MKKQFILMVCLLLTGTVIAQPSGTPSNGQKWHRGGNNSGGGNTNNVFGTNFNSGIYTMTEGVLRMRLNDDVSYGVNGFPATPKNGYLLLGTDGSPNFGLFNFANSGAFSRLHIAGSEGGFVGTQGYRPWMKTGITFTDNRDLSYIGLRQVGTGFDVTETVIAWADNRLNNSGPDDMTFRFTSGGGNPTVSNDFNDVTDLDGLHVARFTGYGLMGLGNTFGANNSQVNYVRPQSLLHMSYTWRSGLANEQYGFMQTTYRHEQSPNLIGAGETRFDGLRIGIDNDVIVSSGGNHLSSYLRWQENSPFIVQTDWDNVAGGIQNGERMRVTTIAAPGVQDPAFAPTQNITRVAISHRGDQPITRPKSLLHLGHNTGNIFIPVDDGWRSWMDVGTFTNEESDNMYVGMKREGPDRNDAVVNWGDNQVPGTSPNGPDFLRFIFTSTLTAVPPGQGDPVSQSQDGLEVARMDPGQDVNGLPNTFGKMGVGDFYTIPIPVTHKLHVRGNARLEFVPDEPNPDYLMLGQLINQSNTNDIEFRKLAFGNDPGTVLGNDGTWVTVGPGGTPHVDAYNGLHKNIALNSIGLGGTLVQTTQVDQDGFNMVFSGSGHYSIGTASGFSGTKFMVQNETGNQSIARFKDDAGLTPFWFENDGSTKFTATTASPFAYSFKSTEIGGSTGGGILVESSSDNSQAGITIRPKFVSSAGSSTHYGVLTDFKTGTNPSDAAQRIGYAANMRSGNFTGFIPTDADCAFCGDVNATGTNTNSYGVKARSRNTSGTGSNYGGHFEAVGSTSGTANYGIYAHAWNGPSGNNYAGYFNGDVHVQGTFSINGIGYTNGNVITSDARFKTDVKDLENAMALIGKLSPKTYMFDTQKYGEFNFESQEQMGLIAQEVERVIPTIVHEKVYPAQFDENGNIVSEKLSYKGIEYTELVPLLIAGMQEQQEEIDQKDELIEDLNARLTKLESCLNNILPTLCKINAEAIQSTPQEVQQQLAEDIDVELSDGQSIILNQNSPNPFAERTTIAYVIPQNIGQAQILFHNAEGKLIKTVDILERGKGAINVFAQNLTTGVYTYTLVIDGNIFETKRMVRQ